jgi:hypothetical protein
VLGRIRILAESGLTSMMVLHDYVSKCIVPLQEHTHPTWLYTGVNNITWLERGDGSTLGEEALTLVMGKLTPIRLPTALSPLQCPTSHSAWTRPQGSCCGWQCLRWTMSALHRSIGVTSPKVYRSPGQVPWVARAVLSPLRPPARERG